MPNYLTAEDEQNYGRELLDVSQRAAMQAVAPHLQQLQAQNADLRAQQVRDRRRVLDEKIAVMVPNYREIDANPRWHQWLLGVDLMSGRIRQAMLDQAIRAGDARRVELFFRQFERQDGQSSGGTASRSRSTAKPIYTNDSIKQLYERHRKGEFTEPQWKRIEADIFAAQREGRVQARPFLTK